MTTTLRLLACLGVISIANSSAQSTDTLKVILLAGQSNCEGHAYAYPDIPSTWNVPTIDYQGLGDDPSLYRVDHDQSGVRVSDDA